MCMHLWKECRSLLLCESPNLLLLEVSTGALSAFRMSCSLKRVFFVSSVRNRGATILVHHENGMMQTLDNVSRDERNGRFLFLLSPFLLLLSFHFLYYHENRRQYSWKLKEKWFVHVLALPLLLCLHRAYFHGQITGIHVHVGRLKGFFASIRHNTYLTLAVVRGKTRILRNITLMHKA